MFRNNLKVACYNIRRHRLYSAINVLGLAVGLTASILIGLFVRDELSYDRFHPAAERTYLISRDYQASAGFPRMPSLPWIH